MHAKERCNACVCPARAHSIDICLRGGRVSRGHHRGFMGSALDSQVELLSGHLACVPIGLCDGPDFMFGASKSLNDVEMLSREVAHAVDLCLSGPEECSLGNASPRGAQQYPSTLQVDLDI